MKKKLLSLLLCLVMVLSMSVTVFADHLTGESGWYVNFTGTNPLESNFTGKDMMQAASGMQPGDDITFNIEVRNTKQEGQAVNYYLKNDIIKSFEEGAAKGAAYTYRLSYKDSSGKEKVFYDNTSVGGNDSTEGLEEADSSLDSYFLLDNLDYNETGTVTVYVELDGETQRNAYQDTMAELYLQFQVEEVESKPADKEVTVTKTAGKETVYQTKAVDTGDVTQQLPFIIILGAAGVAVLIIAIILVKRRKKDSEEETDKDEK